MGATTYMRALDAPLAKSGGPFRAMSPSSQPLPRITYRFVWHQDEWMAPFWIDSSMADGDTLPAAGGLKVIGISGHGAGQVAFLWKDEELLIADDVGMNVFGLSDLVGFEDKAEARRSRRKIAALDFEAATFGNGSPILSVACARIGKKWG